MSSLKLNWDPGERVDRRLAQGALLAAVLSGATLLFVVLTGEALDGVAILLLPAIPLLAAGQIRAISILIARQAPRRPGLAGMFQSGLTTRAILGGLRPAWAAAVFLVFLLGWLGAMTGFADVTGGNPQTGPAGCPYQLNDHGSVTCVSKATYERARAGGEQITAGVLLGFFAMHFGVIESEILRRRKSAADDEYAQPETGLPG